MYVERLILHDFRCFEKADVRFNYPGRPGAPRHPLPDRLQNVNLLLGDNGTGKSSVFRGLALGVLAPVIRSGGFNAEFMVRRPPGDLQAGNQAPGRVPDRTEIRAHLKLQDVDASPLPEEGSSLIGQCIIGRIGDTEDLKDATAAHNHPSAWQRLHKHSSPAFFMAAYGASRRVERPEGYSEASRVPRYQRVASLFEEHVGLAPFHLAYLQLQAQGVLEEARTLLNMQLGRGVALTDRLDAQQRPLFDLDGVHLPFHALSDGFRAFVGWFWDLLYQLGRLEAPANGRPPLAQHVGVVIVDEIDLFLHPEWQRRVIPSIVNAFPKMQFFFSSHSPLVAASLERENVFVLDDAQIEQYADRLFGLTPNQVLTSSYFNLRSTRPPGAGTLAELARHELGRTDGDRPVVQANPTEPIPSGARRRID